jgi:hypothetical protein
VAYVAVQTDPNMPSYYNVNLSVGSPGYSQPDDVLLVQWLLHRIHRDNTTRPWIPPTDDLVMDGWIGPQTVTWIRSYQNALQKRGISCQVDGRVDRCPEYQPEASITRTVYTIVWMNVWLKNDNPQVYRNPVADPDCPKKLQAALLRNDGRLGAWGNN